MKDKIATTVGIVTLIWGGYLAVTLPPSERLGADIQAIEGITTPKGVEYQYARVDENNIVLEVIAMTEEELNSGKYGDTKDLVLASHETKGQKNVQFAGIGYIYDKTTKTFTPPKMKGSEIFDETKWEWVDTNATST